MLETVEVVVKTRGLEFGRVYDPGYNVEDVLVDTQNTLKFLETSERLNIQGEIGAESGD